MSRFDNAVEKWAGVAAIASAWLVAFIGWFAASGEMIMVALVLVGFGLGWILRGDCGGGRDADRR